MPDLTLYLGSAQADGRPVEGSTCQGYGAEMSVLYRPRLAEVDDVAGLVRNWRNRGQLELGRG